MKILREKKSAQRESTPAWQLSSRGPVLGGSSSGGGARQ